MRIFYIGTSGLALGKNPTTIDTLSKLLEINYDLYLVGVGRNFRRAIGYLRFPFRWNLGGAPLIVDVYSTRAFNYFLFASVVGLVRGMRLMPIIHGGEIEKRLRGSCILSSYFFSRAEVIICPSSYMSELFHKYGHFNTLVIPNPLDIEDYVFKSREAKNLNILWLRALDTHYNVEMSLSVVAELKFIYGQDCHLHIVGPDKIGMLQKLKESCFRLNIQDNVTFYGYCKKSDWISISEKCSYFINTSNVDNAPVSVKEAMALGLVVVSTDPGGLSHIVDHQSDGILVPVNDSTNMTNEIFKLTQSPDRFKTISINARAKVLLSSSGHVSDCWVEILGR